MGIGKRVITPTLAPKTMLSSSFVGKKNIEKLTPQGFSMTISQPKQKFIGKSR